MKIMNHKLVPEYKSEKLDQAETKNKGGKMSPRFIIIHFTAGSGLKSSVEWFQNPQAKASAHLVIGRKGEIVQLVDFNKVAWHAGVSSWGNLKGFNGFSIGIELDNPGKLTKVGEKYVAWFKTEFTEENVVGAKHKNESEISYWYDYSEEQIAACLNVCKLIMEKYEIEDILGHDDIAPFRKVDPGPLFPMDSFRAKLFGREKDDVVIYKVNGNNVNIRRGPGTNYESYGRLFKGNKVEFIKANRGWFYVRLLDKVDELDEMLDGWIFAELLTKS